MQFTCFLESKAQSYTFHMHIFVYGTTAGGTNAGGATAGGANGLNPISPYFCTSLYTLLLKANFSTKHAGSYTNKLIHLRS